ncbi:group XIIB secretory phospholipase A2-like protein [Vanacampus margaritifer]
MLLRTVTLLLLLCVSAGVCATLGHYQPTLAQTEVEAPDDNKLSDVLPNKTPEAVEEVEEPAERSQDVEAPQQPKEENQSNEIQPIQMNISTPLVKNNGRWSLMLIRKSFQTMHGYFDSLVELVGGHDGVCQYRCRYGDRPQPRPGYEHQEPNGCSSSMVGFQMDLGIPAMTECCNQLDVCYDNCGVNKYDCDTKFRSCLQNICSDLKRSLGFVSRVQACESMADALYNTVWTLGCRPYMNSQRAACVCDGEERDEL